MITLLSFLILALAVKCYAVDPWKSVALAIIALMLWLFPVVTILAWLGMVAFKVIFA